MRVVLPNNKKEPVAVHTTNKPTAEFLSGREWQTVTTDTSWLSSPDWRGNIHLLSRLPEKVVVVVQGVAAELNDWKTGTREDGRRKNGLLRFVADSEPIDLEQIVSTDPEANARLQNLYNLEGALAKVIAYKDVRENFGYFYDSLRRISTERLSKLTNNEKKQLSPGQIKGIRDDIVKKLLRYSDGSSTKYSANERELSRYIFDTLIPGLMKKVMAAINYANGLDGYQTSMPWETPRMTEDGPLANLWNYWTNAYKNQVYCILRRLAHHVLKGDTYQAALQKLDERFNKGAKVDIQVAMAPVFLDRPKGDALVIERDHGDFSQILALAYLTKKRFK